MPVEIADFETDKRILSIEGSKGNSFSEDMLQGILDHLESCKDDDSIKGVILTGSGRSFSVGGDVFAMYDALKKNDPGLYLDVIVPLIEKLIVSILEYPKPIIAAINGATAGAGMSLALACDDLVAVERAKFGMGFGGLGLSPDSGSSVIFKHHFGTKESIRGIATAKVYTAKDLQDRDILRIVHPDELLKQAGNIIDEVTKVSAFSYGRSKLLINQSLIQQLQHNLPLEYQNIKEAASRNEFMEKVEAYIKKISG